MRFSHWIHNMTHPTKRMSFKFSHASSESRRDPFIPVVGPILLISSISLAHLLDQNAIVRGPTLAHWRHNVETVEWLNSYHLNLGPVRCLCIGLDINDRVNEELEQVFTITVDGPPLCSANTYRMNYGFVAHGAYMKKSSTISYLHNG